MSKSAWRAGVVVAALGLSGLAFAQAAGSSGQAPQGKEKYTYEKQSGVNKQKLRTFTLTVKDVNRDQHKVGFEAKVSPEANIMESGQAIKLDQLKQGDQVRASFDPKTNSVVKLEVVKAPRAGSPSGASTGAGAGSNQ